MAKLYRMYYFLQTSVPPSSFWHPCFLKWKLRKSSVASKQVQISQVLRSASLVLLVQSCQSLFPLSIAQGHSMTSHSLDYTFEALDRAAFVAEHGLRRTIRPFRRHCEKRIKIRRRKTRTRSRSTNNLAFVALWRRILQSSKLDYRLVNWVLEVTLCYTLSDTRQLLMGLQQAVRRYLLLPLKFNSLARENNWGSKCYVQSSSSTQSGI